MDTVHEKLSCIDNCLDCINKLNTTGVDRDKCITDIIMCVDHCPSCDYEKSRVIQNACSCLNVDSEENCHPVIDHTAHVEINECGISPLRVNATTLEVDSHGGKNVTDFMFDSTNVESKMNPYGDYVPTEFVPNLHHFPEFMYNDHFIGGYPSQMNAKAWMYELQFENDCWLKSYLLNGINHGFDIVDGKEDIVGYDRYNNKSVYSGPAWEFINELIEEEVRDHKYIVSDVRPRCIHSLGAVPKAGSQSFRPITDCSQPYVYSINNFMNRTAGKFSFVTVDYVQSLFFRDCFAATIDIASAYRSISVNPSHWELQGIRWQINGRMSYLMDTRLCFGLSCAPFIFNQISVFLVRCMRRRGFYAISNYLDDFSCIGSTFSEYQYAQIVFIHLLQFLGFSIPWCKCSSPSRITRYVGIDFDSHLMQLRLPKDKLDRLYRDLKFFEGKSRATCKTGTIKTVMF